MRPNGAAARSAAVETWQVAIVGAGGLPCARSACSTFRVDTPPAVVCPDALDAGGCVDDVVADVVTGDEEVDDELPQPDRVTIVTAALKVASVEVTQRTVREGLTTAAP